MPSKKPQILIRTEQDLIDKLDVIAESQNRSRGNLAETILKDFVAQYEQSSFVGNTFSRKKSKSKEIKISDDFNVNNILQASAYASKKTKIYETKKE